jgi:cyanophycinase
VSPAHVEAGAHRGFIIPVGGAEEKLDRPAILKRFLKLSGGGKARIAIIPTASLAADTGERYEAIFDELGAYKAESLAFEERGDGDDDGLLERLEHATGVFLTGGNQLRLATHLGGTPVAKAIRRLNAAGVPVAGTSAGAAFLSEHMIAFGDEGSSPRAGIVTLTPGLGLTNRVIIDQHFRQRDRLGRLLTALAYNPFAIGLGLDEDTAAFIGPDNVIEVVGSGTITVVDPTEVEFSSMDVAKPNDPICMLGIKLHILIQGSRFNLETRQASAGTVGAAKG